MLYAPEVVCVAPTPTKAERFTETIFEIVEPSLVVEAAVTNSQRLSTDFWNYLERVSSRIYPNAQEDT